MNQPPVQPSLAQLVATLRAAADSLDRETAERVVRDLVTLGVRDAAVLQAAGQCLIGVGSYELAVACLEAAHAAEPSSEIANDLGVALQRSGDFTGAERAYSASLERRPDAAEALANRAVVRHLLGRNDDAWADVERAAERNPNLPGLAAATALIESYRVGLQPALARLLGALRADATDVSAWTATVNVLMRMEQYAQAQASAEQLVALARTATSYELLATCLRMRERYTEALAALDEAARITPGLASTWSLRGDVLIDVGDIAGAKEAFAQARAADPRAIGTWVRLVQLQRFERDSAELAHLRDLTASVVTHAERVLLEFALARALLDAGESAEAFEHFAIANGLRRSEFRYDVATDEVRASMMIGAVEPAVLERMRGTHAFAPIFVVGMPRSGTTLIEQILASVPGTRGGGELPFARQAIEEPGPLTLGHFEAGAVAVMAERYASRASTLVGPDVRLIDKMPSNWFYAALLHAMFPNARIVHVMRDPLDTCLSLYTSNFAGRQDFAYDFTELGRYYRAYTSVVAHWRAVLPAHAYTEVRYEDVVDDFEPTVRRLLTFCGLPWDEGCRSFHTTSRPVSTSSRTEVRRPLYRSSVGRSRRHAAYLQPLIAALGDVLPEISATPPD